MLLEVLRELPPKGSLRESVLLLYLLKKEEIAYTRDLALVQVQVDKDKGIERFNEYRKAMFPWIETAKKRGESEHRKLLLDAVGKGPISVRPINVKPMRSRLVQRVEQKPMTPEQKRQQNELYKKLGRSIPL